MLSISPRLSPILKQFSKSGIIVILHPTITWHGWYVNQFIQSDFKATIRPPHPALPPQSHPPRADDDGKTPPAGTCVTGPRPTPRGCRREPPALRVCQRCSKLPLGPGASQPPVRSSGTPVIYMGGRGGASLNQALT